MKTLTCRELGGACDQELSADSWDDMVKAMTAHVIENHPDNAKEMEGIHKKDPEAWDKEMKPKWDAAPEKDSGEVADDETEPVEDNEMIEENMFGQDNETAGDGDTPGAPSIIEDK